MSAQVDELKNVIASLENVVKALEAEEAPKTDAPADAQGITDAVQETAAEEAAPVDGQVAENTPSADVTVE